MLQHVMVYLTLSSFFLKLCGATDIPCTVTQEGKLSDGEWRYSVADFNETDCVCQWLDEFNYVIANGEQETVGPMVVSHTDRTLVTNVCLKLVNNSCTCYPKGAHYMATCTSNCSGNPGALNGAEIHHWIIPTVVIPVVLLLLGLLVLLCCKFKGRLSRNQAKPKTPSDGRLYDPVSKENSSSSASSDVEDQR